MNEQMNPRNQSHPCNQFLFITAVSTQLVFHASTGGTSQLVFSWNVAACLLVEHHSLSSTHPLGAHLHATSCYPSQRSPRNQLLFITAVSTQPVAIHSNVEFIIVQLYHWPSSKCHWARGKLAHATNEVNE